ncbi:MAG: FHA domain-containing protein, partial [Salinisphaera sp.]|nr:FHA domain-containing protein [Salinisphaera sp.]
MRLSLTVIGAAAGGLAPQTCKSWVDRGGTIGRAEDNDWVLPDPGQEISRCHAKIRFMNDGFYMEDASANGVFLNDRGNRLAPGELHRLQDGERLFVSDYQIAVQVDEDDLAAEPATPSTRGDPGYDPVEYAGGSGDYAEWDPLQSLGGKVETPSASVEAPPGGNRARQSYLEEHFSPAPVRPETPAPQPPPQGGGEASVIPADWWKKPAPGEGAPAPKPSPEPAVVAPVVPSPGAGNPRRAGGEGVVSPAVAGPPPPHAQTHRDG